MLVHAPCTGNVAALGLCSTALLQDDAPPSEAKAGCAALLGLPTSGHAARRLTLGKNSIGTHAEQLVRVERIPHRFVLPLLELLPILLLRELLQLASDGR